MRTAVLTLAFVALAAACDENQKKNELLAKTAGDGAAAAIAGYVADAAAVASATRAPAPSTTPPKECPKGPDVAFDDPDLEAEIRKKLGKTAKPEDKPAPLRVSDLAAVTSVNLTSKASLDELDPCIFPMLKGLKHLYLGKGKLRDLTPIANLVQLESLRASINEVSDLAPLEKLVKLDRLDLGRTQVKDIGVLAKLVNLTELELDDTPISDVAPLASCKKLERLSIKRTNVTDVSPLRELAKLKTLEVAGSGATNLDALAPLTAKGLKIKTN